MRLHIIAVSQKVPNWVNEAFQDYHKRFPKEQPCALTEIPLAKRSKTTVIERAVIEEGHKIQAIIPKNSKTIALDVKGMLWSTETLAHYLSRWQQDISTVNFVIGGPDGLSQACLDAADERWSLSPLLSSPSRTIDVN